MQILPAQYPSVTDKPLDARVGLWVTTILKYLEYVRLNDKNFKEDYCIDGSDTEMRIESFEQEGILFSNKYFYEECNYKIELCIRQNTAVIQLCLYSGSKRNQRCSKVKVEADRYFTMRTERYCQAIEYEEDIELNECEVVISGNFDEIEVVLMQMKLSVD